MYAGSTETDRRKGTLHPIEGAKGEQRNEKL